MMGGYGPGYGMMGGYGPMMGYGMGMGMMHGGPAIGGMGMMPCPLLGGLLGVVGSAVDLCLAQPERMSIIQGRLGHR